MRFSLKSLIMVTLLIGVGVSFVPMLASIRRTGIKAAKLQDQIDQNFGGTDYFSQQTESAAKQILRLAKEKQRLQTVRDQIGKIFAESVEPESLVNSREGTLSVREIPLLDSADGFHKQFRVAVPENGKFQLRLRFTNDLDERDNDFLEQDFETIKRTSVPLNPGQAVVDYSFRVPNTPDAKSPSNPQLIISVDGQPVFESYFMHAKSNGSSSSVFSSDQQRDYGPNQKKLPRLVKFRPSPGKTSAVLSIEELQPETGEP